MKKKETIDLFVFLDYLFVIVGIAFLFIFALELHLFINRLLGSIR